MNEVLQVYRENPTLMALVTFIALKELWTLFRDSATKNYEASKQNTETLIRVTTKLEHFEKTLERIEKSHAVLEAYYSKHEQDIRGMNQRIKERGL